MKIKDGYTIRKVADSGVVVSLQSMDCDNLMIVNGSGFDAWNFLKEDIGFEGLIDSMLALYEVDEATLRKDMTSFIQKLREAGILDE